MNIKYLNNVNSQIFIISLLVFLIKWSLSFYEYGLENLFIKFLFNPSGDYSYFPFIHQLSTLTFNEGYSVLSNQNDLIGFPFLVIIFHAIFYKIFGLVGILIIELICIFIFIKIFFEVFKIINFSNNFCLLISFFLFSLLPISNLIYELSFPYSLNLKNLYSGFYSLRFPRPIITNLFFFSFILFSIRFYLSTTNVIKYKNFIIMAFFLGLMLNSFFYFFIVCSLTTLFLYIAKEGLNFFEKQKIFLLVKFLLILIILSSFFLIQIIYIEDDYLARVGTLNLLPETKIFIFDHLIKGFSKVEFWFILIINIIFYKINIKFSFKYKKFINFFFILFFSSIISPVIYLLLMDKITFFSNFIFIIALSSFILLKVNLIIFLKIIFDKYKIRIGTQFLNTIILLIIIVNTIYFKNTSKLNILSEGVHFNFENKKSLRKDLIELTNILEKKLGKNYLLLTNDLHTQIWWIFSNEKKFYFPYVFFTSLKDELIEKQIFNAFKILKLNEKDFINFIDENKLTNWRVVNTNNYFFLGHLKYQANYLTAFNNLENYPTKTREFVGKKTVHLTNQVILDNNELSNLKKKFSSFEIIPKLTPELIILLKNNLFEKNIDDLDNFNLIFENSNYIVMEKK